MTPKIYRESGQQNIGRSEPTTVPKPSCWRRWGERAVVGVSVCAVATMAFLCSGQKSNPFSVSAAHAQDTEVQRVERISLKNPSESAGKANFTLIIDVEGKRTELTSQAETGMITSDLVSGMTSLLSIIAEVHQNQRTAQIAGEIGRKLEEARRGNNEEKVAFHGVYGVAYAFVYANLIANPAAGVRREVDGEIIGRLTRIEITGDQRWLARMVRETIGSKDGVDQYVVMMAFADMLEPDAKKNYLNLLRVSMETKERLKRLTSAGDGNASRYIEDLNIIEGHVRTDIELITAGEGRTVHPHRIRADMHALAAALLEANTYVVSIMTEGQIRTLTTNISVSLKAIEKNHPDIAVKNTVGELQLRMDSATSSAERMDAFSEAQIFVMTNSRYVDGITIVTPSDYARVRGYLVGIAVQQGTLSTEAMEVMANMEAEQMFPTFAHTAYDAGLTFATTYLTSDMRTRQSDRTIANLDEIITFTTGNDEVVVSAGKIKAELQNALEGPAFVDTHQRATRFVDAYLDAAKRAEEKLENDLRRMATGHPRQEVKDEVNRRLSEMDRANDKSAFLVNNYRSLTNLRDWNIDEMPLTTEQLWQVEPGYTGKGQTSGVQPTMYMLWGVGREYDLWGIRPVLDDTTPTKQSPVGGNPPTELDEKLSSRRGNNPSN